MKHVGILALLLGTSMMVSAAVVPQSRSQKTPVMTVDISHKEIPVDVPGPVNYAQTLKDPAFENVRGLQGMLDPKYARNAMKMMRDDPEGLVQNSFKINPKDLGLSAYSNKKALGSDREPSGFNLKDENPENANWTDAVADIQLPEFPGTYDDLAAMREELQMSRDAGVENIKKLDIKKLRAAPLRQAL